MNIHKALNSFFGYSEFRQGQLEIIENVLNGENVIAVLPTGAGKSICYQIPALISDGFSIVVSPLIALMKDQVDALNRNEERAAFINSTMSFSEAENVLRKISFGSIKLLYVAPERLEVLVFAERIKKLNPEYLFVDEAHCISEWGHNFRPGYTRLKEFITYTGLKKVSAFTATATPEVIRDIIEQLDLKKHKLFVRGFKRENLNLNVLTTGNKKTEVLQLIRNHPGSTIIYTSSRKQAEEISGFLNLTKVNCEYYHAGVNPIVRRKIQDDFISGNLPVIAATNAFGMGIDKQDIRLIVHYNIPGSIENYYQEIGRAGRDGRESFAYLLYDEKDISIQNYFIESSHPDKHFIQQLYQLICDYSKVAEGSLPEGEIPVNVEFISAVMQKEISRGLLHSALKLLESGGFLRVLSDFDKKSSVQILIEKDRLKNLLKRSINPVFKDLLLLMIREYGSVIFEKRHRIDIDLIAQKSGLTKDDTDSFLEELNNMGFITYAKITGKENIILTRPRVNTSKLNLDYKRINENYLRFQNKLQQMVDYVFTNDCRAKFILDYFGEQDISYKCGKCDKCSDISPASGITKEYIKELLLRTLYSGKEHINETSLIKILTGKEKSETLQKIETFGSASNIARMEIKSSIAELIGERKIERNRINNKYLQLSSKGKEFLESSSITEPEPLPDYTTNLELFNLLKEVRSKASKKFIQPGYIICPDDLLRNIAEVKPRDKSSLMKLNGFNERMFVKIGHDFLEIINDFLKEPAGAASIEAPKKSFNLPRSIKETYNLLLRKYSLKDMAALQRLSEAVVSMQIETILEYYPEADIYSLSDAAEIKKIEDEIKKGVTDLKLLKEALSPGVPYSLIRIVVAKVKAQKKNPSSPLQYKL